MGTLYLVPTPIGNLGDISRRMADTLEEVDFIAAEDTRVSLKLLNHLDLKKPMLTYHRHNTETGGQAVIDRLLAGENGALVTDAGMPAISDPGEELVARCAQPDIPVVAIPGPCALVTALAVSGQPTGRFTFEGFLAMNKKNRRVHLDSLRNEERTMIFYEAPHKLSATLRDLADTEKFKDYLQERGIKQNAFFLDCIHRALAEAQEEREATLEDGLRLVEKLRAEEGLSLRDGVKRAAKELGLAKNQLYDLALGREN